MGLSSFRGTGHDSSLAKSRKIKHSDPKLPQEGRPARRFPYGLLKFIQVSARHPNTQDFFHSYPNLVAERCRHLHEGGKFLIHPFSLFSLTWATIMIISNIAHMCLAPFRLSYIIYPAKEGRHDIHFVDCIILALDVICWVDIAVKFNSGYVEGMESMDHIILDRNMIVRRYIVRWLVVDLASGMPAALTLLLCRVQQPRWLLVTLLLPLLRCVRLHTVVMELKTVLKCVTRSHIVRACTRLVLVFLVSCHWCSCVIYLPPVFSIYWYGEAAPNYASFLTDGVEYPAAIYSIDVAERYQKSIFVILSTFFGTGFSMFHTKQHGEILLHSLVILYAALFMVYTFVFLLKVYMTIYSSNIRYHALIAQVEEYMKHKQFPLELKKRVRDFYYYRYQEKYYNEENVLNSLSESLRNEITFHSCSTLAEKVALFRGVPAAAVGSIMGSLQPTVFMPNEFVFRAGEVGHHMYFIASGTVAVYSMKGVEISHLSDGAYFGEVALLMKDKKRVATVVAVEISLLYKLHFQDFKEFILSSKDLSDQVEALASARMHKTVVMDEDVHLQHSKPTGGSSASFNTTTNT